jgi:Ca2+-binding RTX toxin-like protein
MRARAMIVVYGGNGDDYIIGGLGNDTIDPGLGADTVYATYGDDVILGTQGVDAGPDLLFGGTGNDAFEFAQGTATGGPGNDGWFLGCAPDDPEHAALGDLTITDFHAGQDRLILFADVQTDGGSVILEPQNPDGDNTLEAGDPGVTQVGDDLVIDWAQSLGDDRVSGVTTLHGLASLSFDDMAFG